MQEVDWLCLQEAGKSLGLEISAPHREAFDIYMGLLQRWQVVAGLTAVLDKSEMIIKHFVDSLHVAPLLNSDHLLDVGSGGGFPGAPLAICVPNLRLTFLEKESRKCRFLEMLSSKLRLDAVVQQGRSDEIAARQPRRYPAISARALASPLNALAICQPLLDAAGEIILQVGPSALEQLDVLRKEGISRRLMLENMISYELPRSMGKRAILVFRNMEERE